MHTVFKRLTILFLLLTAVLPLHAVDFKGTVYARKKAGGSEPLPFAQVYYLEQKKIIETDGDGVFHLDLSAAATLIATYVGYSRDTVVVAPGVTSADFYLTGENEVDEAVVTSRQAGISKLKPVKTEVITAAGLCKMACCALAESFENSASVTVGYSDAVTGAKQIKLLGLSGTYTQMLDENRPVMRGLLNPFGMSYVPGQWLESIQIAKGPSSVINGLEAITGQINMEHRKPTDETPLFVQLYGSTDAMFEANVASALQFGPKWSTIFLAHVGGTAMSMDMNGDSFRDAPENMQINLANRWLYYDPSGTQVRFGFRFINEDRLGGQMKAGRDNIANLDGGIWGSHIVNRGVNGYLKVGVPINEEHNTNIALVLDATRHHFGSFFGTKDFLGEQTSLFANLLFNTELNERHRIEFGATFMDDFFKEEVGQPLIGGIDFSGPTQMTLNRDRNEVSLSTFGEYSYTTDKMTFVGGLNLEYNWRHGWLFAPRANFKYSFTDEIVFRALGGRGYRCSDIFADNLGMFSSGRLIRIADDLNTMEDAWTFGGNLTFYLPFGFDPENTYLSFDYFHNSFNNQVIVDQECTNNVTEIYNLDGASYTDTWQVDFTTDPFERFNVTATFRYTDARVSLNGQGLVERPMTSRFKAVLNMQYTLPMNRWIFDFTAQLNGPMRLPRFAADVWGMEKSPVYPMLYVQVTRKFRGLDVYLGAENLLNYRQKDVIIHHAAGTPVMYGGPDITFNPEFSANCVWGPLMGTMAYAGLRYTLWKM